MAKDRAVASPVVRGGNPAVLAYCATQNYPIHWLDTFDRRKFVLLIFFPLFFSFSHFQPLQISTPDIYWLDHIDRRRFVLPLSAKSLIFFLSFFFFLLQTFSFTFPAPPNVDSIFQFSVGVGPAIAPGYSALHATNGFPRWYRRRSATDRVPRRYFPPFPCAALSAAPPLPGFH